MSAAKKAALAQAKLQSRVGYAQTMLTNNTAIAERIAASAKAAAKSVVGMRNPLIPKDQRITLSEACAQAGLGGGKANELATLVKQQAETAKLQGKCLDKEARKLSGRHKKKVPPVERFVRLKLEYEKSRMRAQEFFNKILAKGLVNAGDEPELTAEINKRLQKYHEARNRAIERAQARKASGITRIKRARRSAAAIEETMMTGL